MERIVIDTNVFISSLRSANGASYRLLRLMEKGSYEFAVSVPLVTEYEDVAKKQITDLSLNKSDIETLIDNVCSLAIRQKIFFLWRPFLKDPKDDHVLEVAVSSNSKYIITFNTKYFGQVERFGIEAITPQEFLQRIGEIK